jgi:hypothetical protein
MRIFKLGVFTCLTAVAVACSSNNENPVVVPEIDSGFVEIDAGNLVDAAKAALDAAKAAVPEAAPAGATFTMVYSDIISPICVQCHNPAGIGVSMGHLDMSTKAVAFSDLVGVAASGVACGGDGTRVVAGNANNSILFKKVDPNQGSPCGSKMPLGLTPLTTAQADEISSWINAGALND